MCTAPPSMRWFLLLLLSVVAVVIIVVLITVVHDGSCRLTGYIQPDNKPSRGRRPERGQQEQIHLLTTTDCTVYLTLGRYTVIHQSVPVQRSKKNHHHHH